jgi:hypothetical protein
MRPLVEIGFELTIFSISLSLRMLLIVVLLEFVADALILLVGLFIIKNSVLIEFVADALILLIGLLGLGELCIVSNTNAGLFGSNTTLKTNASTFNNLFANPLNQNSIFNQPKTNIVNANPFETIHNSPNPNNPINNINASATNLINTAFLPNPNNPTNNVNASATNSINTEFFIINNPTNNINASATNSNNTTINNILKDSEIEKIVNSNPISTSGLISQDTIINNTFNIDIGSTNNNDHNNNLNNNVVKSNSNLLNNTNNMNNNNNPNNLTNNSNPNS